MWKTEEIKRSDNEVLLVDVQDCKAAGYSFSYGFLVPDQLHVMLPQPGNDPPLDYVAAHVFDIPSGKTAQDVALTKLSEAPEKERARCIAKPDAAGTPSSWRRMTSSWPS